MKASMTQAEFSRHIGKSESHVSQLKSADRLVINENGNVSVTESLDLIAATEDPSKKGVAERHQQEREASQETEIDDIPSKVGNVYHKARAMKEKYAAMQAKLDYEEKIGKMIPVSEISAVIMDGDTTIRNRLETMPDTLSPQLAIESDEQKIRAILIDHIEWILTDLSGSLKEMGYI